LATGAEADLMPFLIARYFGLRHYGRIYGVLFSVFLITSGIAPYLFGLTFDRFGSYRPALMAAGALFACSALLLLTLGRYPQPIAGDDSVATKERAPQVAGVQSS
jgi:MFS family permease